MNCRHALTRRPFLLAAIVAAALYAEDFTAKVVGITDGDTIKVLHTGVAERVRLWGIDCTEAKQPFGTRARSSCLWWGIGSYSCFCLSAKLPIIPASSLNRQPARDT